MESQILFLGTAGDSFVLSKQKRTAAGLVLHINDLQILLNPGPGAFLRAAESNINLRETTAIIVTDATLLHAHDTNAIIDAMTVGTFDKQGILIAAKSAIESNMIAEKYQHAVERLITMHEQDKVELQNVQIQALKIKNSDPHAIGIKIVTPEFSLAYTNKTKHTAALKQQCKDVELLIVELPLVHETKRDDGLCIEDAKKLIGEIKPQLAVLTGFGVDILKQDILEITRSIQKATNVQVTAARDNFALDPTSYALKLRQKRLRSF